jgi:hypothetical protein
LERQIEAQRRQQEVSKGEIFELNNKITELFEELTKE